jgi:hypothetical protein
MLRFLVVAGVSVLVTNSAQAQAYCDQVRLAVATYGLEASKRHALANYGKEAVEAGEKCLKARNSPSGPHANNGQGRRPRS